MAPKQQVEPKDADPALGFAAYKRTEQEEQCERIFRDLDKAFKKLDKAAKNPEKAHVLVKGITEKLKNAKGLIKDFESEARADAMPARELAQRRKTLAAELNGFIALKKEFVDKAVLMNGGEVKVELGHVDDMSVQQLVQQGKSEIREIDDTLGRAERILEDTKDVGKNVSSTLKAQTEQLGRIGDDLNEIEYTMKNASKLIRDITRGLLTDKCIAFLLLLTVVGVVAIIVIKIINPNKKKVAEGVSAIANNTINAINGTALGSSVIAGASNAANGVATTVGRRALLSKTLRHLLELNATL